MEPQLVNTGAYTFFSAACFIVSVLTMLLSVPATLLVIYLSDIPVSQFKFHMVSIVVWGALTCLCFALSGPNFHFEVGVIEPIGVMRESSEDVLKVMTTLGIISGLNLLCSMLLENLFRYKSMRLVNRMWFLSGGLGVMFSFSCHAIATALGVLVFALFIEFDVSPELRASRSAAVAKQLRGDFNQKRPLLFLKIYENSTILVACIIILFIVVFFSSLLAVVGKLVRSFRTYRSSVSSKTYRMHKSLLKTIMVHLTLYVCLCVLPVIAIALLYALKDPLPSPFNFTPIFVILLFSPTLSLSSIYLVRQHVHQKATSVSISPSGANSTILHNGQRSSLFERRASMAITANMTISAMQLN